MGSKSLSETLNKMKFYEIYVSRNKISFYISELLLKIVETQVFYCYGTFPQNVPGATRLIKLVLSSGLSFFQI